jgi:hypothetical protein
MHSFKLFIALTMLVMYSEALFVDGGLTFAALLGLKVAAWKGFAIGAAIGSAKRGRSYSPRKSYYRRTRWGRSIEDETEASDLLLQASLNDSEDCAKKLVCSLAAKDNLDADEARVAALFGQSDSIDLSAVTAEFDLAALMGRKVGQAQCDTIYARCGYQPKDLMDVIRQTQNSVYYNNL